MNIYMIGFLIIRLSYDMAYVGMAWNRNAYIHEGLNGVPLKSVISEILAKNQLGQKSVIIKILQC